MKKGRHRRYEEARALKRGGDLDIDSIFSDLSDERSRSASDVVTDEALTDLPTDDDGDDYDEDDPTTAE